MSPTLPSIKEHSGGIVIQDTPFNADSTQTGDTFVSWGILFIYRIKKNNNSDLGYTQNI